MRTNATFTELIDEAQRAHFEGWDFSYIRDRWAAEPLPWNYHDHVRRAMGSATSVLDLGTGGGEVLASFAPLPARIW